MDHNSPTPPKATQVQLNELANFLYSQYEQSVDTSSHTSDDDPEDPFIEIQEMK